MKQIIKINLLIIILIFAASCENSLVDDKTSDVNNNRSIGVTDNGKSKSNKLQQTTTPNRKWDKTEKKCIPPAKDCFPDIIVTPNNIGQINTLDALISNNSVLSTFFNNSSNYSNLFPGLYGQALTDLQNNNVYLTKDTVATNKVIYILTTSTGGSVDYSQYY